jgi:hypothetical protein
MGFDLVGDPLTDALGRQVDRRADRDTGRVVLCQTFVEPRSRVVDLIALEDDLEKVDRRIATPSQRNRDVDRSPRCVGTVDRNDQVLNHETSLVCTARVRCSRSGRVHLHRGRIVAVLEGPNVTVAIRLWRRVARRAILEA